MLCLIPVFQGQKNRDIEIKLVNILGEIVKTQTYFTTSSFDHLNLDISDLSNGIYNVVVISNNQISTKQLQILR